MLFGDFKEFAIEAVVEPELKPPCLTWGRMCIWVKGRAIGDLSREYCLLGPSYKNLNEKVEALNSLWLEGFAHLSVEDIWNLLDGALYGWRGNRPLEPDEMPSEIILVGDEQIPIGRLFHFEFLTHWGEMFDHKSKAFLLKQPGKELSILHFNSEFNAVDAFEVSELRFRQAVRDFSTWYRAEVIRLRSNTLEDL